MKERKSDIINLMVQRIKETFPPEKILLFGSRARGDDETDSDIDLLIILDIPKVEKRKIKQQIYLALAGIGLSKDIVIVTPEEVKKYKDTVGTVIFPAIREGKVLYEKVS